MRDARRLARAALNRHGARGRHPANALKGTGAAPFRRLGMKRGLSWSAGAAALALGARAQALDVTTLRDAGPAERGHSVVVLGQGVHRRHAHRWLPFCARRRDVVPLRHRQNGPA
jgi:hypothetical protein